MAGEILENENKNNYKNDDFQDAPELEQNNKLSDEKPKKPKKNKFTNHKIKKNIDSRLLEKENNKIDDGIENKTCLQKFTDIWDLLKGYILTITFALCSCVSSILVKKGSTLSGSDSAVIRYFVQFITMLIIAKFNNLNPFGAKNERKLLTYRGIAGITNLLCGYFALKFINPSDFKAINHSSIIITAILARIFLKEKLTIAHVFALILTIIGVLLISQPSFITSLFYSTSTNLTNYTNLSDFIIVSNHTTGNTFSLSNSYYVLIGILFSIVAAVGGGSARVILKKLCSENVHYSIATIYASYYGLPVSLIISTILVLTGLSHNEFNKELKYLPEHLFYNFLAAFIGVIGQCVLNIALRYEDASKLAIVKTIDVFYAFILQYLFLGIQANELSISGACTIVTGAFLVLIYKIIENKRRDKHERRFSMIKTRRISFGH